MVAELLEPHNIGQHQPAPLDAVDIFQRLGQFVDQLGIKGRLPLGKSAEGADLDLVGQVVDDAAVGLQPPEDVGLHQVPQRRITVLATLAQFLGKLFELGLRAQQARTEKIEQRPEIRQAVFDRRAGQNDPRIGLKLLDGPGLAGGRVLNRLGLVQHGQLPADLRQPLLPREHAVAGHGHVDIVQRATWVRRYASQFFLGRFRRMKECGGV